MTTPLLATKLCIPPVRSGLVPRPRLIERLNAGLHCKLTLVSAQAGSGKTTLISEWLQHLKSRGTQEGADCVDRPRGAGPTGAAHASWLSLDDDDNDPMRFLIYLIAALVETGQPDVGAGARALLQSPQTPPLNSVLGLLINSLAAVPTDFVLVLDDYHVIERQSIHDGLAFLLDHMPAQMHLVIAGRVDPPLPLPRLRARGQLIELPDADLRFTPEETALIDTVDPTMSHVLLNHLDHLSTPGLCRAEDKEFLRQTALS